MYRKKVVFCSSISIYSAMHAVPTSSDAINRAVNTIDYFGVAQVLYNLMIITNLYNEQKFFKNFQHDKRWYSVIYFCWYFNFNIHQFLLYVVIENRVPTSTIAVTLSQHQHPQIFFLCMQLQTSARCNAVLTELFIYKFPGYYLHLR